MLISNDELKILVQETNKILINNSYQSPAIYTIFSTICRAVMNNRGYFYYPAEVIDKAELDAIIKMYKAIPRFNITKGNESRLNRGLSIDYGKSLYRYLEITVYHSFLTTFSRINSKQLSNDKVIRLGEYHPDSEDYNASFDICSIEYEDIDAKIDEEDRLDRQAKFEAKLDRLEKQLKRNTK